MENSEPLPENSGPMDFKDQPETTAENLEMIEVEEPEEGETVSSPLHVEGKARGPWFFEAQAGYELIDSKGNLLAVGVITAEGEWMTEDFVPFSADISFDPGSESNGVLILKKANPSGIPENDSSVRIPVSFKE